MKYTLPFFLLLLHFQSKAQLEFNNFDSPSNLIIQSTGNETDTLWQIGTPQKTLFNSSFSPPNALITDTINSYPINSNASFIIALDQYSMFGFPFLQVEWLQKTDLEEGVDGGVIEASYDSGETWLNVFNDTSYRPDMVGAFTWDTLYNDQAGITGINDEWSWMAICWGTYTGVQPNIGPPILIRFTLYSDSIDTNQEGWMIDDIRVVGGIIGSITDNKNIEAIAVYPNPSKDIFHIETSFLQDEKVNVSLHNVNGVCVWRKAENISAFQNFELDLSNYSAGSYFLKFATGKQSYIKRLIKLGSD